MAALKYRDIKEMPEQALLEKLDDLRKELIKLRGQASTGTPIKNPNQIKEIKKTIARIKTAINQKKIQKNKKEVKTSK